jgi:hypothetical protein
MYGWAKHDNPLMNLTWGNWLTWAIIAIVVSLVIFAAGLRRVPTRRVVRPHAIARLVTWGKRSAGPAWGIVAIPDSGWQAGDTLILLTGNAELEQRP